MAKRIVDEEMRFNIVINGNEAQKELIDLEKDTKRLTNTNKELRKEKALLAAQGKKNSVEYKNLTAEIKANNATLSSNKERMKVLQSQIGVTGLTMNQLRKQASILRLQLNNMVPGSSQFKKLQADLQQVNTQISKLSLKSQAAGSTLSNMANGFNKYAALGASIIAGATGIVLSAQKVIDYNGKLADSQSNVQKTTGMTADEVDKLTKKFGLFKTRTARMELLQLAEEAGRLGKTGVDDVFAFVNVANQLKVALGDDLGEEQIREVGKMVTVYKVAQKEGKNFEESMLSLGSSINEVSASGANQASYLVDFLKRTGGISDVANIAAQDMIGLAAAFDEAGQSQEISATAINKFYGSAAEDVEKFAKVAGVSIKEYSRLLEEDANEALILFLKGVKKGDPTLEQMTARLQGIELGGTRGAQAISAVASNIENLEEKQRIANESLKSANSLTNEYNIKNNNLAATIDKVKKKFHAAFSSQFVVGTLTALTNLFGKLIGAIEDVDEAFAKESQQTFESAKANRKLANESQNLLDRYLDLKADGVEPTIEAKEELDLITLQLKDRLGESVMSIDAETGAYILNTEAVKAQIAIKRLASDNEAATLASRLKGVEERKKELDREKALADKEYELRKKFFEEKNKKDLEFFKKSNTLSAAEEQKILEQAEGYKEFSAARRQLQKVNSDILEQTEREIDLTKKLNELNFSKKDVDEMFKTDVPDSSNTGPKEGDTKIVDGVEFVYKDGKWVIKRSSVGSGGSGSKNSKIDQTKKEQDELIKLQRETIDQRLALLKEGYDKEMALTNELERRKIEDLKKKAAEIQKEFDKEVASNGNSDRAAALLGQYNEILDQIELTEEVHQQKRSEILNNSITARIENIDAQYKQEEDLRKTNQNNQLIALGNDLEARKLLEEQFKKEDLEREKAHQEALKQELLKVLDTVSNMEQFDIELLSEEQKEVIVNRLTALGLKISEINALLATMSGKGPKTGEEELAGIGLGGSSVDILGMSPEQWEQMFMNTETLAGGIGKVVQAVGAAIQAYKMFSEFQNASDERRLQKLEATNNSEKAKAQSLLDRKLISQKQYDKRTNDLDKQLEKEKAQIAYKQAKREKLMAIASIKMSTAQAILSIWAQYPKVDFGVTAAIASAAVGALGALQVLQVIKTPLPAKGYEQGFYGTMPIQREQDGKLFNAEFGGASRSGMVDKPTVFLAGEGGKNFPEMIIDGRTLSRFNPELKSSLYRELGRVKGFENGYYKNDVFEVPGTQGNDEMLKTVLIRAVDVLERLEANGVIAYMSKDFDDVRQIRDRIDELKKIENKSIIN